MATEVDTKREEFILEWKIKNFNYCWQKKGDYLKSPSFVSDALEGTKWNLVLFPRGRTDGNYISLNLRRDLNCNGPNTRISIEIELSSVSWVTFKSDHTMRSSATFSKGSGFGFPRFQKRKDIFMLNKDIFLPEDTLIICCKMWRSDSKSPMIERYSATTHITVGRMKFLWTIEKFSDLQPDEGNTFCVTSASDEKIIMFYVLTVTGGQIFDETLQIKLTSPLPSIFFTTSFFVLNTSGGKEECGRCEFWFDYSYKDRYMTLLFTKEALLAKKSHYLPNDVLTLQCECAYSTENSSEEIEKIYPGCVDVITPTLTSSLYSGDNCSESFAALKENLQHLYNDGFLSDVNLHTNSGTFPAHKIILSARSPVFKAMFTNNMKEKSSKIVDIKDLDDDTVHRMLLYIYTAKVEDLCWESAFQLYMAADKYEILSLKTKCSAHLATNLTPNNACDVLILSDLHQDEKLKSAVQNYILKNDKVIINSEKWELLMKTNSKLAANTLCLKYK
ncbi:speckle-type POZ protein-like isoform X4 [Argiope bruennichi]|uniref:speckle-type POZ protein-like isoform X4 n=1 Tax=Argiope bruennichi TaxID=94029 RepID=UPI002493FF43|nr:speckle-type POZ protein-like isoform X4 [Argiope bruennichi]